MRAYRGIYQNHYAAGRIIFKAKGSGSKFGALQATATGFGTEVTVFPKHITDSETAKALRDCDVIIGCTDDEWGRSILSKLAFDYYIPIFDMGVKIDSQEGAIVSVQGRVTTLLPGTACLLCRGRITTEGIRAQVIESCNSEQGTSGRTSPPAICS